MKIYLASPFFNDNEIANIHRAAEILKVKGHEVFGSVDGHIFDLSTNPQQSLTHGGFRSLFFR